MQFLYPNILWGLLALAIPLAVHLFNFRRTKRVYFSNVTLLKSVDTQTSSFRKLKNLLVMLARMLFIAALVLAFAQPVQKKDLGSQQALPQGINGIYLDNSQSMQNTSENKRLLDLGIIKIDELITLLNRSSNLQLTTNDFDGADQFVSGATRIKDRLTTLNYSESMRSLSQVYKRQKTVANKHNPSGANHFFWFSDFQKSTVGDLGTLKTDSNDVVHLVPMSGKAIQNVFVDSVWLEVPFVREMQNNVLHLRVYNSGNKQVEKLPLKLFVDDVQISTSSVDIPANGYGKALFNFTISSRGVHKGKISFDDQPITFDNNYYFVLDASPAIRVKHLYGQRSGQDYVSKIFSNDSLFQYTSHPIHNFNPGDINSADLLVLEGVSSIEGELKSSLELFLNQGGHLALIPSEQPSQVSLQAFLGQYGIQKYLVNSFATKSEAFIEVGQPDKSSPFYADVFEKGNSLMSLPKGFPKTQWTGVGEKILGWKNDKPFISRTKSGDGYIYLFSSPLQKEFGDFAEHALFVPTMFKMAYLSSKADRLAYNFSEGSIHFYMPNAPKNAVYKLKSGSLELIPSQSARGKTLVLTLPKSSELQDNQLLSSGLYNVEIDGKVEKVIALNHGREESFMDFYTSDELRRAFAGNKNIQVYEGFRDGDFLDAFRESLLEKSYWKQFIIAALVFLLLEILLTRFWRNA